MNAARLRHVLAYRLRWLRWQGVSGLLLTLVALVYALLALPAASARLALDERQIIDAAARLREAETAPDKRTPTTPAEQIAAFYTEFPAGATVPDWLEKIYALAETQGLALDAGEYALSQGAPGRLEKFRISFPVKGSYPQIRKFIAAALATAPALALDGLYLKRDKVSDGSVDARIVFLLYLEKGA